MPPPDYPAQPVQPIPQPIPDANEGPPYPEDGAAQPCDGGNGERRNPTRVRRPPQMLTYSHLGQPAWQPHNAQLNSLFIDPHQQQQPTAPPPQFQGYSIPQPTVPQGLPSFNTLPLHHHNQPIPGQSNPVTSPTTNFS